MWREKDNTKQVDFTVRSCRLKMMCPAPSKMSRSYLGDNYEQIADAGDEWDGDDDDILYNPTPRIQLSVRPSPFLT